MAAYADSMAPIIHRAGKATFSIRTA